MTYLFASRTRARMTSGYVSAIFECISSCVKNCRLISHLTVKRVLISVVSFHFQPLRVIVMYKCTQQNTGYDVAVQFVCPSVCHTCVLCVNGKMCCLVGLGAPLLFFILHERLR